MRGCALRAGNARIESMPGIRNGCTCDARAARCLQSQALPGTAAFARLTRRCSARFRIPSFPAPTGASAAVAASAAACAGCCGARRAARTVFRSASFPRAAPTCRAKHRGNRQRAIEPAHLPYGTVERQARRRLQPGVGNAGPALPVIGTGARVTPAGGPGRTARACVMATGTRVSGTRPPVNSTPRRVIFAGAPVIPTRPRAAIAGARASAWQARAIPARPRPIATGAPLAATGAPVPAAQAVGRPGSHQKKTGGAEAPPVRVAPGAISRPARARRRRPCGCGARNGWTARGACPPGHGACRTP